MKTKLRILLSLFLALLMMLPAIPMGTVPAFAETNGDFEYSVISQEDKICKITKYNGVARELTIPSQLDGYIVTSIGHMAFSGCTSLTSIELPNSVTSIEQQAFIGCTSLTSITIPNGVTRIEYGAFNGCISLASITIPDSVTSIENYTFCNCTSLTSIIIPDSVTSIGHMAFSGCTSLTSITIPNGVTNIDSEVFRYCTSLTSITIPNSVTSVGDWPFSGCQNLSVIYGYIGSYAESYARSHGKRFIDISTGVGITATLAQNEINLSLFDKDAFVKGNVDFFGEHRASVQHRLNGVQLTADGAQQNFDNTAILTAAHLGKSVTLSKNGYQNYTIPAEVVSSWFESDSADVRNIYMSKAKKDGNPYISGVYAKENGKSVAYTDLQSESLTAMDDTAYNVILTAEANGESVQEYVLSQDDAHKLTSKNGVFSAKTLSKTFTSGKEVYAYVKTSSGKTSEPVKVNLKITDLKLYSNTFSLIGKDGQSLTFAKDAPLVGNASLSLDGFKFPIGIEMEGDRFKISFGIDVFSLKSSNDGKWKDDTWDSFKKSISNMQGSTEHATDKLKHYKNFVREFAPGQYYSDKSKNFDTSFLGYAEGYIVDGKMVYTDFCGEVALKFSFNYTQQGTIWVIPVYAYVKASASAAIQLQSVRAIPDSDVPFDFGMNLNIKPELTIGGGIGVKGAVSGGLYGKGSLPVSIHFAEQHANVKLSGQIGIEGECFCFSGKKTLVDGTVTLYDQYYGSAKTATAQSMLRRMSQNVLAYDNSEGFQSKTVTTVMSRDYAEKTSKWLGISFLDKLVNLFSFNVFSDSDKTVADGLTVKELQTSVFKNSQTQLISLNNGKMMVAWIEDDSARNTYNRMRLVYSIYENGLWSKPKAVSDDGTNDAYPSLATDGETIYVAWQNLKRTLTANDADSIDAVLKNSEICIAKYNSDKNVFENEKTLTNNTKYDYSPSLAVENAQAVLYWKQSKGNDLSAADSNDLYRYATDSDAITKVKSDLNYMTDMECAFVNGKDEVSFAMDADGNLSTTEDIYVYTLSDGVMSQQTPVDKDQPLADFAVTYGTLDGQNTLFFADSTNVYYKQNGEVKKVFSSAHTVNGDLQVLENDTQTDLLWTEISEAGTEIWLCSYSGGVWSNPVQISNIGALLHDVSAVYQNGVIHGVFDRTARTQENGEYISGQTDFCYMTLSDYADLEASLITVEESKFTVGETAKIPVYLKNNGTEDIDEVEVTVTDTLGTIQTVRQAISLRSGEEKIIDIDYLVPQNYGKTTLTVSAKIPNRDEIITANNTDNVDIGYADINMSEISVNDVGEYFVLSAVLKNSNPIVAQQVHVKIYADNEKDKLLEFITLGDLEQGEMHTVQYIVLKSAVQYDEDNLSKICFAAETSSNEKLTADNISCAVLENTNTYFGTLLGDIDGNGEINSNDYAMVRSYVMCQIALTEEQRFAADYNRDSVVDAFDAIAIDIYIHTK